jgi:hypothetical protein
MKKTGLICMIGCCLFGSAAAEDAAVFWNEKYSLNQAKIIPKHTPATKQTSGFPGKTGLSVQWNNSAQIWFGNSDILPATATTAPIKNYFIPEENRIPWMEFFEADFTVTDSVTDVRFSTAWHTAGQLTGHIRKGFGLTAQAGYASLRATQTNYLNLKPFVPTTEEVFVPLTVERKSTQLHFFSGLYYQFLHKRVQPAVTLGYQLLHLRSSALQFAHGPFKETVPLNTSTVLHGWRVQFMAKVFVIRGFYMAPQLEFGQLYNLSNTHTLLLAGGAAGYQFDFKTSKK